MSKIVVRYGDLNLKGKNKKYFIAKADSLIKEKLSHISYKWQSYGERFYIEYEDKDYDEIIKCLKKVSGLQSYSIFDKCDLDIEKIKELALIAYDNSHIEGESFKIEARRVNKNFEYDSYGIMREVSAHILRNRDNVIVDVHNPDLVINVEIRDDGAYVLRETHPLMGGYPTGTGGKALVMMSGGIDSPVAAFELIKQGMTVELVHFESSPLTSIESAQKVVDLTKKLCEFTRGGRVVVHFVPFVKIHQEILGKVNEEFLVTVMRRCMYKISARIARIRHILAIANGESIGQVASQTVESMHTINDVTSIPVLRPLLTRDKKEIIKIARLIDTYDISIRPFEDCCTVYVPKHPSIHPTIYDACIEEEKGNFEELIEDAIKNTTRLEINKDTDLELAMYSLNCGDAIKAYKEEMNV